MMTRKSSISNCVPEHTLHRASWRPGILLLLGLACLSSCKATGGWPPAPALTPVPDRHAGPTPSSVTVTPLDDGQWRCTFRYEPDADVERVQLAGTFNNWRPERAPLTDDDGDGVWTTTVDLPAGRHLYKLVINGTEWRADPRNADGEPDGHSGRNSVLRLGHVAHLRVSDARLGDGEIDPRGVRHDPERPLYVQRVARDKVLVRMHTLADDVEQVWVTFRGGAGTAMHVVRIEPPLALWEAVAPIPTGGGGSQRRVAEYTFVLADGHLTASHGATYTVPINPESIFHTPDWAKHAVWYQIMVDRFRNGERANDRDPVNPWTQEWFSLTPAEQQRVANGDTFYNWIVFDRQYGGDIQGLMEKLPYLKALGVNAIYLMPMFKAESNHKYNAETYIHIDDHFGFKGDYDEVKNLENHNDPSTWRWTKTDKLFIEFIERAHRMGFKVIIDGVFNHVGTAHPAFQDVKRHGRDSKYADWFNVTSWEPFEYEGWGGFDALPVFKKDADGFASEKVKQHIFDVTRRWMDPDGDGDPSDGIDGWRLDVPNEVPAPFWAEWRAHVKSINPDAYITGEIWEQADEWLDGRHFDAVMNYEFAKAACAWVFNQDQKITASEVARRLRELRMAYPREATYVLQNLMDSHDTDRVASMALNPDRAYDAANRIQDNGPNYDNSKPPPEAYRNARLTALLQMTYVGAPMVYYGDEVGMWGADDPTCRKPMLWQDLEPYEDPDENHVMAKHRAFYKSVMALRNAHPTLRTGSFRTLLTDDVADVWVFLRENEQERLIVALNASDRDAIVTVPLDNIVPCTWRGVFGMRGVGVVQDDILKLSVPAIGGVVLVGE